FATGDQARILDWDHGLIVVTVERPRLHLTLGTFAAVQQRMKRVQAMIAPFANLAQRGLKLVWRLQPHSTISIPSSATCQPALSTLRRSAEPSTRIGFVLLT